MHHSKQSDVLHLSSIFHKTQLIGDSHLIGTYTGKVSLDSQDNFCLHIFSRSGYANDLFHEMSC